MLSLDPDSLSKADLKADVGDAHAMTAHKTCLILIGRTVAVGTPKNLLTHVGATEPENVPGRLTILDAALCAPLATNRLVVRSLM